MQSRWRTREEDEQEVVTGKSVSSAYCNDDTMEKKDKKRGNRLVSEMVIVEGWRSF